MGEYTTYEFYQNEYYGESINESSFPKWLSKATDKLNAVTFGNITEETFETFDREIQKATCAVMDLLFAIAKAETEVSSTEAGNIKSVSSGSESITFGSSDTLVTKVLADKKAQDRLIRDTVSEYLAGTGLMYAGV